MDGRKRQSLHSQLSLRATLAQSNNGRFVGVRPSMVTTATATTTSGVHVTPGRHPGRPPTAIWNDFAVCAKNAETDG